MSNTVECGCINNETCGLCFLCNCKCKCLTRVIEEKVVPVTYGVQVKFHEWKDGFGYSSHASLEEAIKNWFILSIANIANDKYDCQYCHVMKCPTEERWVFLLVENK
jgi:hypothetical protein